MNRPVTDEQFEQTARLAVSRALSPDRGFRVDRAEAYHCASGKPSAFIRPTLAFRTAKTLGIVGGSSALGKHRVSLMDIARCGAALQLAHESTLPADDWMDQETKRRGQIPLYAHPDYGPEVAVMTSLRLLSRVYCLVAQTSFSSKTKKEITLLFDRTAQDISRGQEIDLFPPRALFPEKVIEAYRKTGALFGYSAELGALVVGASKEQRSLARGIGECAGVLYQLRDDITDLSRDTSEAKGRRGVHGVAVSLPAILNQGEVRAVEKKYVARIEESIGALPRAERSPLGEFVTGFISRLK
ncbi:MAG: polyprenyl synthetase family protein [Nanoarchaeota archaeon]